MSSMETEIIRLLKAIVNSVNENSQLIKQNNELLHKNQELIKEALTKSGPGSADFGELSDTIKKSVVSRGAFIEVYILQDVRQMMGMVSNAPTPAVPVKPTKSQTTAKSAKMSPPPQAGPTTTSKPADEEPKDDSLLRPSDLFG